ncbi:MAG: hypothetical protein M1829_003830 [Trizodia sp. TS-e1964]|nr:MAG: hypothetical protein M1829_003830 [Trizodia sp. TS-e1964]
MNTSTAYTPLETLLLFQSLAKYGTEPRAFIEISDLMKGNPLIRNAETFDTGRLSPDALRELFLSLWEEESRSHVLQNWDSGDDGNSLTRNLQSGSRKRKLSSPSPQSIYDDSKERKFLPWVVERLYARYRDGMIREIQQDEQKYNSLHREIREIEEGKWDERLRKQASTQSKQFSSTPESSTNNDPDQDQHGDARVPLNPDQGSKSLPDSLKQKNTAENANLAASSSQDSHLPITTSQSRQQTSLTRLSNGIEATSRPKEPAATNSVLAGRLQVSETKPSTFSRHYVTASPTPQASRQPATSLRNNPISNSQPKPPPGSVHRNSSQPSTPSVFEGMNSRPQTALKTFSHLTQFLPSSLQTSPKSPTSDPSYSSSKPSTQNDGPAPVSASLESQQQHPGPLLNQHFKTPLTGRQRLSRPPPLDISASSTRWKPTEAATFERPASPLTPGSEAKSPLSERSPSPLAKAAALKAKASFEDLIRPKYKGVGKSSRIPAENGKSVDKPDIYAPSTELKTHSDNGDFATSAAPIIPRNRESSDGAFLGSRKIKNECPPTPTSRLADIDPRPMSGTKAENADWMVRQSSQVAIASIESQPIATNPGKRKRNIRDSSEILDSSELGTESPGMATSSSQNIMGNRNFPRTCTTIMNGVGSHKYASLFANPVKERDAPGYKQLIYRSQDLKSIKAAIYAGGRVVTAAFSAAGAQAGESGSPGANVQSPSKTSSVWLQATPEIVPPKGIVNSAQLEKELMRMFANAIMFNPSPDRGFGPSFRNSAANEGDPELEKTLGYSREEEDGVVKDTREMFEHVEKLVTEWRAAERTVERQAP